MNSSLLKATEYSDLKHEKSPGPPLDVRFIIYSEEIWKECSSRLPDEGVIADFGYGGGTLLYNLAELTRSKLIGIDYSKSAILESHKILPDNVTLLHEDIQGTSLEDESIDFSFSTMVIEHIDDHKFLKEVYRVLKPGGFFLVTSVIKHFSWYFYKNADGERVLDPSHVREYKSSGEFEELVRNHGFTIIQSETPAIKFPLLDIFLKPLAQMSGQKHILTLKPIEILRLLTRIQIPGYSAVEVLLQKPF